MYKLTLTERDEETVKFIGGRYAWSWALNALGEGEHQLAEHEAWELLEEFERDTIGGHDMFPMLDPKSELADKLYKFVNEVV